MEYLKAPVMVQAREDLKAVVRVDSKGNLMASALDGVMEAASVSA
jgi:hypothetical protein